MKLSHEARRQALAVCAGHEEEIAKAFQRMYNLAVSQCVEITRRQQVNGKRAVELGRAVREMQLLLPPEERTTT